MSNPILTFLFSKKPLLMLLLINDDTCFPSLHSFARCIVIHNSNIVVSMMTTKGLRVIQNVANHKVLLLVVETISVLVVYYAFIIFVITKTHYKPM